MNKAVVVDTNIIVAALLSPEGAAFERKMLRPF